MSNTSSQTEGLETNKTGETSPACNSEFMQVVFGELREARPIVVSFQGDPSHAPSKCWLGKPWHGNVQDAAFLSASANNYFSLAAFTAGEAGGYRRQKSYFAGLYAVMLDDIGTKVSREALTLQPSWLLQTSPGNHQAGYLLREPLADGDIADRLMDSIVAAGLCDPGSNGPRTRLARLPIAANGKHSPAFRCRMVSWLPALRYSVAQLVHGLELEVASASRRTRIITRPSKRRLGDADRIWIPRHAENPVLIALRERGLYKAPLGDGKHDITCPWVAEHTGETDGGTAYLEPDINWPIGGFKCFHGHCAARHIRDFLDLLDIETDAARMKPIIHVVAGEIHRVVDAAERHLVQSGRFYQRGGLIVTIVTDPGTHESRIQECTVPALVRALAGAADWVRFDGRAKDWVRTDPPARHTAVLFDSQSYHHLPVLRGLARQPYLRADGSIMMAAGYDLSSQMFGVFNAAEFPVPKSPTVDDARSALTLLKDLLAEFRFSSETYLAAAFCALLTAAVRPSLAHAPMFHAKAHMVGSGKSYLCELITAFATPQRGTPTTFPGDDEESRKLLLAELLRGPAVIEFDNLTGDLVPHKSLCTALTSEYLSGRILGTSKTVAVSTRTLFLSSGNNAGPVKDMTRRCITIHLDPACEVPASRVFRRPELVREVLCERGRYVAAALTIVRAWIVAGRPRSGSKALAGYSDWSEVCVQPLLWLGLADPTESAFDAVAADPEREVLQRFHAAWEAVFGKTPIMVRELIAKSIAEDRTCAELREIIQDIAGEREDINRRKLGRWIKRHLNHIVDGRRFVRANSNGAAEKWSVEAVAPVPSVSSV